MWRGFLYALYVQQPGQHPPAAGRGPLPRAHATTTVDNDDIKDICAYTLADHPHPALRVVGVQQACGGPRPTRAEVVRLVQVQRGAILCRACGVRLHVCVFVVPAGAAGDATWWRGPRYHPQRLHIGADMPC